MRRLITAGDLDRLEVRFMKFHAGQRDAQVGPVRVMDVLRHLEEVDNAYFAHLESRRPTLKGLTGQITTAMAAAPEMADRQLRSVSHAVNGGRFGPAWFNASLRGAGHDG